VFGKYIEKRFNTEKTTRVTPESQDKTKEQADDETARSAFKDKSFNHLFKEIN